MARIMNHIMMAAAVMLAAALAGPSLHSKPMEPVLVLGFDTKLLNDVQERLLRESVMRRLQMSGYRIVPVMEIEAIFHGDEKRQIRKLSRDEIKGLCEELKAGYACHGSLVAETAKADGEIKSGVVYICSLTLFNRGNNAFETITIRAEGEDDLYGFYGSLSKKIAEAIVKVL